MKNILGKVFRLVLVLAVATCALTLAACQKTTSSGSNIQTKQFQYIDNTKGIDVRLTYTYNKSSDKVTKQTTESYVKFSALKASLGTDDLDSIKASLNTVSDSYNNTEGASDKLTYKGNYVIDNVVIDYAKVDLKKLSQLQGVDIQTKDGSEASYISFKKSAKMLKDQGYTEVKNKKFQTLDGLED